MATAATMATRPSNSFRHSAVFPPSEWGERVGQHGVVVRGSSLAGIRAGSLRSLVNRETLSKTLGGEAADLARIFYCNLAGGSVAISTLLEFKSADTLWLDYQSAPVKPAYTVRAKLNWLPRPKPMAVIDE